MLDVKNPEINVDDLMERIREEARRRREWNARREQNSMEADWAHGVDKASSPVDSETIDQALTSAQQFSAVGLNLPAMTRLQGFRRKLAIPIVRIILRLAQLVTRDQRAFNAASLDMFRAMHEGLKVLAARLEEVTGQAQRFAAARIATLREEHTARLTALGEEHAALREEHAAQLAALREEHAAQLAALREEHAARLTALGEEHAALREEHAAQLAEVADLLQAEQARIDRLRTALLLQERRLSLLLEEARRRLPEPFDKPQLEMLSGELEHLHDPMYVAFEDQFRGTREDIKDRMREYLPLIREAGVGMEDRSILDIGCGRGEWLEVLKEEGLHARGADLNRTMVAQCHALGLEAIEADSLAYLRSLPDASLGAVTGHHIIEHLPFPVLLKLLDETVRVLRPGGLAIFETPNPQNLLVGACNFYVDPTHRNPLHPDTMRFLAEARGLVRVEIRMLHPYGPHMHLPEDSSPIARKLNDYLYGPQDFAVIGYRA